jgi:opacity protein-like surface antigen
LFFLDCDMKRFRFLFPVVAGVLLAPAALAQQYVRPDASRPSAHFGITTGLATTWVVDDALLGDPNYEYVQTYRRAPLGFTLGYHFNDRNGVQIEANRTLMGGDFQIKEQEAGAPRVGTKNLRLTYWSVPIMFKYTSGAARRTRFEFHVGPQLNFLQSAEDVNRYDRAATLAVRLGDTDLTTPNTRTGGYAVKAGTSETLASKSSYRSQTIGAAFGLGIELKIVGPLYASALARATITAGDIRSDSGREQAKATGYYAPRRNAAIGLQIGLHWQFISPEEGHPKDRSY